MANGGSQSWGDLQNAYGLSDSQVNSLKSAGYTNDQASQLLGLSITSEQSSPGNTLSVIGGGQAGGLSPSTLIGLAGALKGGGGGGGGGGLPTGAVDPSRSLENLGAAALNQQAVYNPQPGAGQQGGQQQGADFLKSGVQQIGGPTMTAGVPSVQQGPWTRVPGLFTSATGAVTPGTQIAPVTPLSGIAPTTGPGTGTTPGPTRMTMQPGFAPVQPTAARPITPTPQPTGTAFTPGQAWAQAPAAPGIQVAPQQMPAQPMPYTGTVHNDPFMSNAVSKLMGLASNPWHPGGPGGSSTTMTASPTGPIKMSSGGWVPGDPNDNSDSVPAQLSPGEFVVPKKQASETVHAPISTQSSYSPPPAPTDQSSQQSNQSPAASTHTNVGAGNETIANLGKLFAGNKGYTTDPSTGTIYDPNREVYMSPGSGYTTKGGALYDPQGDVYMSNPAAGAGGGVVSPQVGGAISSGIGAIGSAIQSALSNVPSWKIQPSAIPDPSSFKRNTPQYSFQPPRA